MPWLLLCIVVVILVVGSFIYLRADRGTQDPPEAPEKDMSLQGVNKATMVARIKKEAHDISGLGTFVTDGTGTVVYSDGFVEKALGVGEGEFVATICDLVHPDDRTHLVNHLLFSDEVVVRYKHRGGWYVSLKFRWKRETNGYSYMYVTDVTYKEAEKSLLHSVNTLSRLF